MSSQANARLSLNTTFSNKSRPEEPRTIPGRRRAHSNLFNSLNSSSSFSRPLPSSSVIPSSTSLPTSSGLLPPKPIDSESFPIPLENSFDTDGKSMYKVATPNVYLVPYTSSPMGSHPAWSAQHAQPYQPYPETNYYPGQSIQYFEDVNASRHQRFVVPHASGYDSDSNDEDGMNRRAYASDGGERRSRRASRNYFGNEFSTSPTSYVPIESRVFSTKMDARASIRPPPSVSPANSSATDESGRSSSYGSTSSGSGRSVRWNENLVAPSPAPNQPRPKGWFNRRGDQLWCNDGRYKAAVVEYPPYLRDYPDFGEGWMNEHGVRISMTHRRLVEPPSRPLKGVLKNNISPIMFPQ